MSTNDPTQNPPGQETAPTPRRRNARAPRKRTSAPKTNGHPADADLRALIRALKAVKKGDFSVRLDVAPDGDGIMLEPMPLP